MRSLVAALLFLGGLANPQAHGRVPEAHPSTSQIAPPTGVKVYVNGEDVVLTADPVQGAYKYVFRVNGQEVGESSTTSPQPLYLHRMGATVKGTLVMEMRAVVCTGGQCAYSDFVGDTIAIDPPPRPSSVELSAAGRVVTVTMTPAEGTPDDARWCIGEDYWQMSRLGYPACQPVTTELQTITLPNGMRGLNVRVLSSRGASPRVFRRIAVGSLNVAQTRAARTFIPDPRFSGDGEFSLVRTWPYLGQIVDTKIQSDGKIVLLGSSFNNTTYMNDIYLARLRPDGEIDQSFGTAGFVIIPGRGDEISRRMVLARGGAILVAGKQEDTLFVRRLKADGSVDERFGKKGEARARFRGKRAYLADVLVDTQERITLVGVAGNPMSADGYARVAIARFSKTGTPDRGFSGDGTTLIGATIPSNRSPAFYAEQSVLQSDGKILAAGYFSTEGTCGVVRVMPNGSLDASFGSAGFATYRYWKGKGSQNCGVDRVNVDSAGRIMVTGYLFNGLRDAMTITRFTKSGELDTRFSGDGKSVHSFGRGEESAEVRPLDAEIGVKGALTVVGVTQLINGPHAFILRLRTDGSRDPTFGYKGLIISKAPLDWGGATITKDGQILAASWTLGRDDGAETELLTLTRVARPRVRQ